MVQFKGGLNIAIKIPRHKYEESVAFYRDILNLTVTEVSIEHPTISRSHKAEFGPNILWLDCIDNYTHSEIWLEMRTDHVADAAEYLKKKGVETRDELEQIPEGKHWIMDPAGTVFILDENRTEYEKG